MTKVELHPAILFHCDLCTQDSWHNCTLRTGMEAMAHLLGDMGKAVEMDEFIHKIRQRCHESKQRCPPLPNFRSAVSVQMKFNCKNCNNTVGSAISGFNFTCDDCGRDNYFLLDSGEMGNQKCRYCGSQFEVEHFLNRGENGDSDDGEDIFGG